jgi:hypothetical protein
VPVIAAIGKSSSMKAGITGALSVSACLTTFWMYPKVAWVRIAIVYPGYFRDPGGRLWESIWNPELDVAPS